MLDLEKHLDFFNPENIEAPIHIIGAGAVGSTVAEMLTRTGCSNLHIYDFDRIEPHNITNQMFLAKHIGLSKVEAITEICKSINPSIKITTYPEGYTNQALSGYVFLCADKMKVRKETAEKHRFNFNIKAVFDFRMGLADAQHFYVNWKSDPAITAFINGTDFDDKDAESNAPRNACGTFLNIASTVRTLVSVGIINFMKVIKEENPNAIILINVLENKIVTI